MFGGGARIQKHVDHSGGHRWRGRLGGGGQVQRRVAVQIDGVDGIAVSITVNFLDEKSHNLKLEVINTCAHSVCYPPCQAATKQRAMATWGNINMN